MVMDIGYAAEGAGPLENHFKRKDLSETVTYIQDTYIRQLAKPIYAYSSGYTNKKG